MQNIGRSLKKTTNQMKKSMDAYARQFQLTGMQMSIIDYLSLQPNQTALQKDIEGEFQIQRSTATVLLQRMTEKKLIESQKAATDGRQKQVVLTQRADDLKHHVSHYITNQQTAMTTAFSEAQLATFFEVLNYFDQLNGGVHHETI